MKKFKVALLIVTAILVFFAIHAFAEEQNPEGKYAIGIVTFGKYEQDNNQKNDDEPLEWIVLKNNGDNVLLLCKDCIYAVVINEDGSVDYNGQRADNGKICVRPAIWVKASYFN